MGFISTALGKSLFTETSYAGAVGKIDNGSISPGYGVIVIYPSTARLGNDKKDPYLIGLMKDKLSFSVEANWSEMGGFASVMPSIPILNEVIQAGQAAGSFLSNAGNIAGASDLGAVYSSKLIYHKSGYLLVKPSFRIVDWDGTGRPLKSAFLAASYCVPTQSLPNMDQFADQLISKLSDPSNSLDMQAIGKTLFQLKNLLTKNGPEWVKANLTSLIGKGSPATAAGISNAIDNTTSDIVSDYLAFRSSPSPVQVFVGEYFYHSDMVITNVNIEFSKEATRQGPLYVDITLDLSSRKIMGSADDLGFSPNKVNRLLNTNTGAVTITANNITR